MTYFWLPRQWPLPTFYSKECKIANATIKDLISLVCKVLRTTPSLSLTRTIFCIWSKGNQTSRHSDKTVVLLQREKVNKQKASQPQPRVSFHACASGSSVWAPAQTILSHLRSTISTYCRSVTFLAMNTIIRLMRKLTKSSCNGPQMTDKKLFVKCLI